MNMGIYANPAWASLTTSSDPPIQIVSNGSYEVGISVTSEALEVLH